ncbi:protein winged eye [Eupeodes corollae]|uniref:protein winged eye n=1 Tax=Eupeodes corollae TaxID=290404 RepID=UPI00248F8A54|nr:protein winged eye [Eupeodes corollae]XP_055920932.1 protein winged eye [Eupeodes corollae]XP_055920941.1 protein winged eye [Eupeodes corollae]XP_055920949.1 protein winged eye [Eupeodes corollae]
MATFNSSPNILNSCDKTAESVLSTTALFVPSESPLHGYNYNSTASSIENHSFIGIQQKNLPSINHHHVNSSSSLTFMEIKREPCQVSEVTTSNNLTNHNSKSMSSMTTTLVKIESSSPIISDRDKSLSQMTANNLMSVGLAVSKKRTQDSSPVQQPSRDINYFGIRVADIGGVTTAGCGNIYFAGADLIPGTNNEDIRSIHNSNRPPPTFWQYPNPFPLESVISMSPVGLQYTRDPNRGQLVLLPAASAIESFQPTALLWPPYMQQNPGTSTTAPNFLFPLISSQPNTPTQSIQLVGTNHLTTTAAPSTVCHHSQGNACRSLSISSDTRRIEQPAKNSGMKKDDWLQQNSFNRGHLINLDSTSKTIKSKENEYNYSESTLNLIGPQPLTVSEQSHNFLNNLHAPSELLTVPMLPNYKTPTNTTLLTPPQIEEANSMYRDAGSRVTGFSKMPEMQDVNIQTDTPICSDDDSSTLEASTAEMISCNLPSSDTIKYTSTQCYNNNVGCQNPLSKQNSTESFQQYTPEYDFSKHNSLLTQPERYVYENEFESNTTANKNDLYYVDRMTVLTECNSGSLAFKTSTNPPLVEMSGLELLSNISTGSLINNDSHKSVCVKQEPSENVDKEHENKAFNEYEVIDTKLNDSEIQYVDSKLKKSVDEFTKYSTPGGEKSLGGLNLLCALAEQRIQEEVESNNFNKSTREKTLEVKKKKHKHSKSKSTRQWRYYKETKKKNSKQRQGYGFSFDCEEVQDNLRRAFENVDKKNTKWPGPEDFFKAMESDMRMRLADITRQYRKKKRKLDEINKIKKRKVSSEYKFANISCKNPSFICFLDKFQSKSSNFPPPANESKIQSLNNQNNNVTDCAIETSEDNEETSTSLGKGTSLIKDNTFKQSENVVLCENKRFKNKSHTKKHIPTLKVDKITLKSRSPIPKMQHKPNIIIKEGIKLNKKIDKQIVLSNEHLYRQETRVLTDMGGLFYAGILKPLQPPDVYAITLDGERGNKSHIMSREDIFKDTILEVVPKTIKKVPTGTRLCAYWSQQYRCLYPGKAIESDTTDAGSEFVNVEFDDGDSGRIRLQNIRYLMSDYPIVEYNENPFSTLGKNKKHSSLKTAPADTNNDSYREKMRHSVDRQNDISINRRNKKEYDNIESNLSEIVYKNTQDSKKKKHTNRYRTSHTKSLNTVIIDEQKERENVLNEYTKLQSLNYNEIQSNRGTNYIIKSQIDKNTISEKSDTELMVKNLKHEMNGLNDQDSPSNDAYKTSDKIKYTKVDYNSGKGSKIAAFLPERQLWGWLGQAYRKAVFKGRARKHFYKSISRGEETITVGECAVFLSTGRPDRPYIGRIEAFWETTSSNKIVRVRWFYHPEETIGCPSLKYPGALFDSPHEDENDVQTISHRCEVIEFSMYIAKFGSDPTNYQSIYDNNDIYYLSGYYNPRLKVLTMQPQIPTLDDTSL